MEYLVNHDTYFQPSTSIGALQNLHNLNSLVIKFSNMPSLTSGGLFGDEEDSTAEVAFRYAIYRYKYELLANIPD